MCLSVLFTVSLICKMLIKSAFDYAKRVSDISETGFGFSGFLHSIGETETGFTKPSKPGLEMVSLTKPEIVHVFTLNYLLSSSLKL